MSHGKSDSLFESTQLLYSRYAKDTIDPHVYISSNLKSRLALLVGWIMKRSEEGANNQEGNIWVKRVWRHHLLRRHEVAETSRRAILQSGYNSPVSHGNNIRRSISNAELLHVYTVNMLSLTNKFWCNEWRCVRTLYKSGLVLAASERNKPTSYKASWLLDIQNFK